MMDGKGFGLLTRPRRKRDGETSAIATLDLTTASTRVFLLVHIVRAVQKTKLDRVE